MPAESQIPASERLTALLAACVDAGASDLHLTPGVTPTLRIHGTLHPIAGADALSAHEIEQFALMLATALPDGIERGSLDGAISGPRRSRFRFNLFRRQGELAVALRRLEDQFRSLAELGLPQSLDALCDLRDGLVIVAGPAGSGKSTTIGTLLDRINRTRACHIITIEDPIEFIHTPQMALVNQRQVGLDAPSFNDALVAALRQDPDVILVGEVRDLATIRTAITAAETGHLVLTTVHAPDCVGVIERLVSVFPSDEQDGIRRQLSLVLRTIVVQHLIAGSEGDAPVKRMLACEVLNLTPAIANLITVGKSSLIYSTMEAGQANGIQTLEQDLARLCVDGSITEASALARARHVGVLQDRMESLRRRKRAP